jgi:hypothetical protein
VSDQLLWVKVPPPRVAWESKLTLALSVVIALYTLPVVTAVVEAPIPVELVEVGEPACLWCRPDPEPRPPVELTLPVASCGGGVAAELPEPVLSRTQAIENARDAGVLDSFEELHANRAPLALDGGELLLEDDGIWRVRSFPQLATGMRPRRSERRFVDVSRGSLDRHTVRRYVKRQQRQLDRCYYPTQSLQLGRTLRGETFAAVNFLIDRDGRVVQVISHIRWPELATCFEQTVATLAFPRSDGITEVSIPLRYGTTDASAGAFVR